ncbi:protein phosphatase 2C domain-containing protein [Streptomyces sp. NRRL F-5630]|uniref:protein phosphatase 2C domain-containing protein n=1 Tax=Streptomyces sp. NRRL F-5630 TaxID=1463864 RepID=UPI003D71EB63
MSQQGDAREDEWWDQLYEESAPDTGPDPAADTLDDHFASAMRTVKPPREPVAPENSPPARSAATPPPSPPAFAPGPPEPASPWPATERLGRPYVPGARPLPDAEADGPPPAEPEDNPPLPRRPRTRAPEENPPLPRRPLGRDEPERNPPLPRRPLTPEATDSPPLPQRPPRRAPATPDGFTGWFGSSPERGAGETPPPPLPAEWTGVTPRRRTPPAEGTGASPAEPAEPAEGSEAGGPPERDEPEGFRPPVHGESPREASDASDAVRDEPAPARDEPAPVPARDEPGPVQDDQAPPEPARSEPVPPGPIQDDPAPPSPLRDESAPPAPHLPRHALPLSPPPSVEAEGASPGRAERPSPQAERQPSPAGEADSAPAASQGDPPRTGREALAPAPPPTPRAERPPSPRAERSPASPGAPARPGAGETSAETRATSGVPYVGDRPPTYEAEPTALAESDPGALDAYVPDTVLEGGRFGGSTLRAVSQRGDSARYRGEARRDTLLVVRFGAGDEGIVLVATATGARTCPEAYRAATEAVRSIAAAVGRSHRRLADDIRAARRGDLKSGLRRLTDRTLGRLRAAAAERGLAPEEYTASLRCLLLPTDGQCRTRVFFGAGEGGLFRLRGGELRDIEPEVPADGQPRSGAEGGALTLDPGVGRPPSPYAPVEEPRREPFRFHASIARSGDVLLLCGTGLAEPLRGSPSLASRLAEEWSAPEPPGLAAFLATSQTRVKGYADDRTLAAVWEG